MKIDDLPTPGDYWKVPVPKQNGDADSADLFAAVGMLLSRWEILEDIFAFLFQRFVEGSNAAKRAYGTIVSGRGRRDAIYAAAESYFIMYRPARDDLQKRLTRVMNHYKDAASRRNDIAHGVVQRLTFDEADIGFFLMPPNYNTNKTDIYPKPDKIALDKLAVFRASYRYTTADIFELTERFDALSNSVMEYALLGWEYDLGFRQKPSENK